MSKSTIAWSATHATVVVAGELKVIALPTMPIALPSALLYNVHNWAIVHGCQPAVSRSATSATVVVACELKVVALQAFPIPLPPPFRLRKS